MGDASSEAVTVVNMDTEEAEVEAEVEMDEVEATEVLEEPVVVEMDGEGRVAMVGDVVVGEVAGKMLIDDLAVRQRCTIPTAETMVKPRAALHTGFEDCFSGSVVVDDFGGGEMTAEVPSSLAAKSGQLGALIHVTKPFTPSYNAKLRLGRFRLALASTPMSALSVKFSARSPSEPAPSVRVDVLDGTTWLGFARPFNLTREWQTFTARVEVPEKSLGSALDLSYTGAASGGNWTKPAGPPKGSTENDSGCKFAAHCQLADEQCVQTRPPLNSICGRSIRSTSNGLNHSLTIENKRHS